MSPVARTVKGLKALAALAGGAAALIPGSGYFIGVVPPLFEASALLTSGVAVAIVVAVALRRPRPRADASRALAAMLLALALVVVYGLGSRYWTVGPPPGYEGQRIQVGFHLAEWSLTPQAREQLEKNRNTTAEELMLILGGYGPGLPVERIWTTWSVIASGLALVAAYCASFILWAYGFALLGRSFPPGRSPE